MLLFFVVVVCSAKDSFDDMSGIFLSLEVIIS